MRLDLPLPRHWHPVELEPEGLGAEARSGALYFERHEAPRRDSSAPPVPAAPCMLTISPLLPLPRSLPALLHEALAGEPDFRPDWKWPVLTPRVGPWELVVQLCVGTSQETGHTTGRLYVALDAGFGAYLIVCIDRDPQKLAERQKEILPLLARARLHRDRVHEIDADPDAPPVAGINSPHRGDLNASAATEIIPPQQPPLEIYLKETLFSHLTD